MSENRHTLRWARLRWACVRWARLRWACVRWAWGFMSLCFLRQDEHTEQNRGCFLWLLPRGLQHTLSPSHSGVSLLFQSETLQHQFSFSRYVAKHWEERAKEGRRRFFQHVVCRSAASSFTELVVFQHDWNSLLSSCLPRVLAASSHGDHSVTTQGVFCTYICISCLHLISLHDLFKPSQPAGY